MRMYITSASPPNHQLTSARGVFMYNLVGLLPVVATFGSMGLILMGLTMLDKHRSALDNRMFRSALVPGGVSIFLVSFAILLLDVGNGFLRRRMRKIVSARYDAIVRPDDEGAVFLSITPLQNINKIKLLEATDLGYFRVDGTRRELLFEGDRESIRIPSDTLVSFTVGTQVMDSGHSICVRYYLHVRANGPDGMWENALIPRKRCAMFTGGKHLMNVITELYHNVHAIAPGKALS